MLQPWDLEQFLIIGGIKNEMGEIANDMIEGRCCALCGQYFVSSNTIDQEEYEIVGIEVYEHGYPVVCKECWEPDCGYEKTEVGTI